MMNKSSRKLKKKKREGRNDQKIIQEHILRTQFQIKRKVIVPDIVNGKGLY